MTETLDVENSERTVEQLVAEFHELDSALDDFAPSPLERELMELDVQIASAESELRSLNQGTAELVRQYRAAKPDSRERSRIGGQIGNALRALEGRLSGAARSPTEARGLRSRSGAEAVGATESA